MLSGLTTHQNSTVIISASTNINLNTLAYFALDQSEETDSFITDDKESYNFQDTYALYKLNTAGSQGFNNGVFAN
jgi:hypothetical protein